jgi:DNA-directed RNA polymerase sigma subunit (sigma70/sigma32)
MKFIKILLLLLNIEYFVKSLYLTNYQLNLINNLIKKNEINVNQRNKINIILFKAFEKFSIKKAIDFKNKHQFKCKDIKNDELIFNSRIGLFKAIQNYNGKYSFINYSNIYINSELLKVITDKYSLSSVPKSYRIKNKTNISKNELYEYKKLLSPKLTCLYESWQSDLLFINNDDILSNIISKNENIDKLYVLSNKLTPSMKRILYLKYYSDENKIMSNKKISILMCCSEEAIRKKICLIKSIASNI